MNRPAITVDLDSTLCDTSHRRHLIPADPDERAKYDWVEYSLACGDDEVFEAALALVKILARSHDIIILSGRSGLARRQTEKWLGSHKVPHIKLVLDEDPQNMELPHSTYKVQQLAKLRDEGYDVVMHVDDWPNVRTEIEKQLGIPTLVITPDYPEVVEDLRAKQLSPG